MAFDQNSVTKDLRPLNVVTTMAMAEEQFVSPPATATATTPPTPNSGREMGSPGTPQVPLFYSPTVSDGATLVGLSYGNVPSTAATTWCLRPAMSIAHSNANPPVGFSYGHSCCNRVAPGNAALNLGNWVGTNGALDKAYNDSVNGFPGYGGVRINRVVANATDQASYGHATNNRPDHVGDDGGSGSGSVDESVSGRKVKFMCSFGGRILPRPSDGMLRYVGGKTRIIISCPDDVEHMMEEYEKLMERSPDGSAKLRVFLFSAADLEISSGMHFADLQDSGQRYVEAVNGIADEISIGITRKESVASAASTQNSDLSGSETLDGLISGDVSAVPKGNVTNSDTPSNLMASEAGGASPVLMGISAARTGPTHTPYFHNEVDLERSPPATMSQQPVGLQQTGTEIPYSSPYLQPFFDLRQEVMNYADYVQIPQQTGFRNAQFLGKTGQVFTQPQFHDNNNPSSASHQVIPGVQMTITQQGMPSHVGMRSNVIQPQQLMQLQQNRSEQYNDENTSGMRILQLPTEHGYNTYQVPMNQVPSVIVGGNYGWVQVPSQDQVVLSDGLLPQQQVMVPEKSQRVEDCSMCQTKLPHAHSDSVVQDQRINGAGPVPDSVPAYHSLPMEDNSKAQAANNVMLREGIVEQVSQAKPQVIRKPESPDGLTCTEKTALPQNLEPHPEGVRIFTQKLDGSDYPRNSTTFETIGRTGGIQSPTLSPIDGLMGTSQLSYIDDVPHRHICPVENSGKQDVLVNKPGHNNISNVDGTAIQSSECMAQGSPKEYSNDLSGVVPKSELVDRITQEHLKSIDGRVDNLNVCIPEVRASNDHCLQPVDKSSGITRITGMLPSSTEILYARNSRTGEYSEVAQHAVWGIPGLNHQPHIANHHKDDAPSSISQSVRFGDIQDSTNSLFSNQDPWNIQHGNSGEQNLGAQFDDGLYQSLKQHLPLENVRSARGSAEDQQLQAVAEDVAASVLHSRIPSNADLHARDNIYLENTEDGEDKKNMIDVQFKAETQSIKSRQLETANFGFPASDVGGLQVIKNCDLEELTELGSGTFGTVYHGKWRGTDVAIKRITDRCFAGKPSEQERMRADFWNEAIKLADLHHPNVVAFYGVVLDGPGGSVATVTEYMVNGSLRNALLKNGRNLDKRKRLLIAMDVAFGMEYLHGKNIVHFDLKSDNLLVNLRDPHRPICKVGDLGLSKVKRQTLISGGVRGTLPWMAPELLNGSSSLVSEKVDVFSFGIVMWELLTGEEPYADLHYGAIIGGIVSNTLRPPVPESCDSNWRLLMENCWSSEPSERPSFTEIANELRSMATKITAKVQNQQQQQQQQQPSSSQSQVQK
ncbi:hypothetical protein PIB30_036255 [Stylosanthes scabra]|uniref:Protein kinase domain-containing protein n=1 Tax=Stylosanthes scabra TaxID=79078 RepID=A0ABU6XD14_9FABA|nr:hypothetical protein [Stylosanthes scabra]